MARVYDNILQLSGTTPLLRLNGITRKENLKAELIAKVEFISPSRSIKDRAAAELINDAEQSGRLKPGTQLITAAQDNAAVSIAQVAAVKDYPLTVVFPSSERIEIRKLIGGYGAKILPVKGGLESAWEKAVEYAAQHADAFLIDLSALAEETDFAGEEIWTETDGRMNYLVADKNTLETIASSVDYLKKKDSRIKVIAAVREGENYAEADISIPVSEKDAREATARLASTEGILAGISAGSALAASTAVAKQKENAGKRIVVILPDTGERYLSTEVFGAVLTPTEQF